VAALAAPDAAALQLLATVRSRWSVEVAEALLPDRTAAQVEALLDRLVAAGVVGVRGTGEWRFQLPAVVREFLSARADPAEAAALAERHATVLGEYAIRVAERVGGATMLAAVATLDRLADDIRAILCDPAAPPQLRARLGAAVARWVRFHGRPGELLGLLRKLPPSTSVLYAMGLLAAASGEGESEVPSAEAAVSSYVASGDLRGELAARSLLGRLHLLAGRYTRAREQANLTLTLARSGDRARDIAVAQRLLAALDVAAGDLSAAHRRLAVVARLAVGIGDERLVSLTTAQLAEVARLDRRPADAVELGRRAAGRLAAYGDPQQRQRAQATVALALLDLGRVEEAAATGPTGESGLALLVAAYVARARGELPEAARLFATAATRLAGRREPREVAEALIGAVACTADPDQRLAYQSELTREVARGLVLLPRDYAMLA
jgi:hypothetical protein